MAITHPWAGLPPTLAQTLRPSLPEAVNATIVAISQEVPAYQGALERAIGPTVRRGVEIALERMLTLFGTDGPALDGSAADFYQRIGAGEYRQGRSLEALLAAYRTGARVSWELMSAVAVRAEVPPEVLVRLAESIFVYIDELSGASAQGHAEAAAAGSGYREVLRSQLAQAVIEGGASAGVARLEALAENAGWPLPNVIAVAVVPKSSGTAGPPLPTTPPDVLVIERADEAVAVIPDPAGAGRRAALSRHIKGPVFVGSVRPLSEADVSLEHAMTLRRLAEGGQIPGEGIVLAVDHLPQLLLATDPVITDEIRARSLRGLGDLPEGKRRVLLTTLAAWLDLQGDRTAVARRLVVHPQTVTYRLGRLRDYLGDELDSAQGRLALQLALMAEQGTGQVRE